MSMIHNFGKGNLVLGLQNIRPLNLFDLMTRTRNLGRLSNQEGKDPFILLFPRSRISKFLQFAKDRGNCPSNWLPLKLIFLKLFPLANVAGMVPHRLFILKSNTERTLKFAKHFGIMPLKLLWDKSRTLRELALQIKEGISPVKLLLETKKYWRLRKFSVGNGPWSKVKKFFF